ncbi:MAG: hypothetical protein LIP01_12340 [Tannerellaceae bacterium]|nr:hypothetical protein [Tannerellaceae bacterium]
MKYTYLFAIVPVLLVLTGCNETYTLATSSLEIKIDTKGVITSLWDKQNGKEYLSSHEPSPLIQIRIDGEYHQPSTCTVQEDGLFLDVDFTAGNTTIRIETQNKTDYLTFEVLSVHSEKEIELLLWGPYQTTIGETVGECVGVSRNKEFAIGIQALNPKTIGGYPTTEDDVDPPYDIFATTSLVDVSDSLQILYRGQTARHTNYGSQLNAYCRNRHSDRMIPMWGHTAFVAPAYEDGGITGSKIALFGSPEQETLDYLEKIELGENLPHPFIEGEWAKRAKAATRAYIIYPFNEQNIEEAIAFTRQTGLKYLYHAGPFKTWGKFDLNPSEFPSGYAGLKKCVEKAEACGIRLGVHTLSNFITPNDGYVTPVPDKRLAKVGSSVLAGAIHAGQTEIPIADPLFSARWKIIRCTQ